MRCRFVCLVCLLLSAETASEADSRPQNLKHRRHVKTFAEHDPPVIATPASPASARGKRQEYENGGGKADLSNSEDGEGEYAVPAHLARADSGVDTAGQHGLDHPSVVVHVPVFECECTEYSNIDIASSSCREGGQVDFNVAVRGLVPGFEYDLEITWTLEGDQLTQTWKSVVTAETDSYTLREPLVQRNDDFHFGMVAWDLYKKGVDRFYIDVTVRDMYHWLTTEEALIGTRNIDTAVNRVRLQCAQHPSAFLAYTFSRERASLESFPLGMQAQMSADRILQVLGAPAPEETSDPLHDVHVGQGGASKDDNRDLPIGNKLDAHAEPGPRPAQAHAGAPQRPQIPQRALQSPLLQQPKRGPQSMGGEPPLYTQTQRPRQVEGAAEDVRGAVEGGGGWGLEELRRRLEEEGKRSMVLEEELEEVHMGLTGEESLIGARDVDTSLAVQTVQVRSTNFESGERTRVPDGEEDEWLYNFSAAIQDVSISYSETAQTLAMLNRYGCLHECARNSENMSDADHTVSDLHIPAVVFNHKRDGRRVSAEGMLRVVGFRDIMFQPTYDIETLDLAALENSGRVSANWNYFVKQKLNWIDISNASKMRYLAHALDFQDVIERHAAAVDGSPGASSWIAVFEDDIVLTTSPVQAHKRLVEAVSSLPRNADVLHVEWCFDLCKESRFHTKYPFISLASKPHCSAGILFSAQGARKLDRLLRPIDSTIDNMFANLCHGRAIYCYKLRLPIFTQDKKWGSAFDLGKQKMATHFHDFHMNLCIDSGVITFDSDFWSWFDSMRNLSSGYTDGTFSSAVVSGRQEANSTACSSSFLTCILGALHLHGQQHGLDHPAVVIDLPTLECACDDSSASSFSSDGEGGDESSHAGTCKAGDQASLVLSVRGLLPGFLYQLQFKWSVEDEQLGVFDSVISTTTSSYVVRKSLTNSSRNGAFTSDLIAHTKKLRMNVAVWDTYPGLTEEEAMIGARDTDFFL